MHSTDKITEKKSRLFYPRGCTGSVLAAICMGVWVKWSTQSAVPLNGFFQTPEVQLTAEEETRLKELFDQYDEDGSGNITQDELYEILDGVLHNKATAIHIVNVS